jgi:4-amino-4-deoxy-L-arabinose transferase-like glycosyltransferase
MTRVTTRDRVIVAGLTLAALVVRVLLAMRGGLWRDEALFLFVERSKSLAAMMDFVRMHESHPPLFYLLMRGWLRIAGDSDAAALVLPLVFGILTVPAIYAVGSSLLSKRVGLLAAALATFSPALAEHSALVRPYSLLPLLSLVSAYTLIKGIESGRRRVWVAYSLVTLAMLYTHNWAWLVLGGEWVAVAVVLLKPFARERRQVLQEWALSQVLIAVGYVSWLPTLIYQARHAGKAPSLLNLRSEPIVSIGVAASQLVQATILAYTPVDSGSVTETAKRWFIALPMILLVADQFLRARRVHRGEPEVHENRDAENGRHIRTTMTVLVVAPLAAWFAALALSSRSELMIPRCLVMLAPALLLVLAIWLERPRTGAMLALSRAAILAFFATYGLALYNLANAPKSNARELAPVVARRTQQSDLVIIAPEWLASSFNRYYKPDVEQIDFPAVGKEGAVDFAGVLSRMIDPAAAARAEARIIEARRSGRRVWLIIEGDRLYHVTATAIPEFLRSPNYGVAATGRTAQIRMLLDSLYGPPDTTAVAVTRVPQYENLRAFLYAPAGR